jgi:hypothetical protein
MIDLIVTIDPSGKITSTPQDAPSAWPPREAPGWSGGRAAAVGSASGTWFSGPSTAAVRPPRAVPGLIL